MKSTYIGTGFMSHNLPNLLLRFLLEITALISLGMWGRSLSDGDVGIFLMILVPSRSGKAPVPVPGWVRLTLELVFFAGSAWALSGSNVLAGFGFGILVILHYLFSLDRIKWLLRQ